MQRFAVFDIDGTVIRWQLYHAVVNALVEQGSLPESLARAIHDARMTWKQRAHSESFRDYEHILIKAYESALTALNVEDFNRAIDSVFEEYKDQVYTYTRDLIRELKAKNYMIFAISGSYQEIVSKLAEHYGFDDAIGQVYEQKAGQFTGEHTKPMLQKDKVLQGLIAKHSVTMTGSIAVGDSEGDIAMLELVERPIAFNPTKGLMDHAREKGWEIVVERKNVIYQLQSDQHGYVLAKTN
jgi:HAD superfamily hydrolase (TIGR01490 family)